MEPLLVVSEPQGMGFVLELPMLVTEVAPAALLLVSSIT
jgi:hypothetical protein